jgi:hypothetical protein
MLVGCAHSGFLAGFVVAGDNPAAPPKLALLNGEKVEIRGDMAAELKRIPEAQVRVTGAVKGKPPERRIEVEDYQILDAGQGVTPHVGELRWDSGRLLLIQGPGRPIIELIGDKAIDLRAQVGARVWVVGPIEGPEKLEVLNFGILKPAVRR